jgi:hypothetical protein
MAPQKQGGNYNIAALSVGSYLNIRDLIFGADNKFAFILDKDFLRIVDFSRSDLVNQQETKLPPSAANIHSISTNSVAGQFFGDANSQIVYDLKTDNDWFLILADRNHTSSQILMQIDPKEFDLSNISIDFGQNPRAILLAGDIAGIFDLPTRVFTKVSDEKGFSFCQWGLGAKYGLCVKSDGSLYKLQDGKLTNFNLKINSTMTSWISPSEFYVVVEGRPVKVNFDTGQTINYAEIAGLQNGSFIAVSDKTIFFTDKEGLKAGDLKTDVYPLPN